jgi:hypothetical protein
MPPLYLRLMVCLPLLLPVTQACARLSARKVQCSSRDLLPLVIRKHELDCLFHDLIEFRASI